MPRGVKDSDDENEIKNAGVGRRTRSILTSSVLDSPLRRSTRNRPSVSHDASSPESLASDVPARSTRRKTAPTESTIPEAGRALRPRMNSNASDTTDFTDSEVQGDTKKRVTRRSLLSTAPETPTKSRLRRTTRAGSESKTMSPSVRTTRRTRASSVDLDDNHESSSQSLLITHPNTPIKTRARASVLPNEPVVAEESEDCQSDRSDEVKQPIMEVDDTHLDDVSSKSDEVSTPQDNSKSPFKLNLSGSGSQEQMDTDDSPSTLSDKALNTSTDNVLENSKQESEKNSSSKLTDGELNKQIIMDVHDKITLDLPKVVLHKTDSPLALSPGNKENQKSNIIMSDTKVKILTSNTIPTQRKSAIFPSSKKIDVDVRHNQSMDDKLLAETEQLSKRKSLLSNTSMSSETPKKSPKTSVTSSEIELVSATISSTNESVIFVDEINKDSEQMEATNDDSNEETIINEPETKTALNSENDNSKVTDASEIDGEEESHNTSLDSAVKDKNSSAVAEEDKLISSPVKILELTDENIEEKSASPQKNISEETPTPEVLIEFPNSHESVPNENNESPTAEESVIISEIPDESVVEIPKEATENSDDIKTTNRRSSLIKRHSIQKTLDFPEDPSNKDDNAEQTSKIGENESETEMTESFKDISVEDWEKKDSSVLEDENIPQATRENSQEKEEEYDLILVDKEVCQVSEKENVSKTQETSDCESDDTVIVQSHRASLKSPHKIDPIVEEPMDLGEDDVEPEENQNNSSIPKILIENINETTNDDGVDELNNSKCKSSPTKNSFQENNEDEEIQGTPIIESAKSGSRKSLNRKSLDAENSSSVSRRSNKIEKSNISTPAKSPKKPQFIEETPMDVDEDENDNDNDNDNDIQEETEVKSPEKSLNRSRKSLDSVQKKKTKRTSNAFFEESDDKIEQSQLNKSSSGSSTKSKSPKNSSASIVQFTSVSDATDSDSSDEIEVSSLPEFLTNANTDSDSFDNEDNTIDSDVAREYNLKGDSNPEYSDDNVPGDECRASETEESDSDDDGDDMADFINDDDEEEEEISDEEEEEKDGVSNEEDDGENIDKENDSHDEVFEEGDENEDEEVEVDEEAISEDETNEELNQSEIPQKIALSKKLVFESSVEDEEETEVPEIEKKKQVVSRKSITPNKSKKIPSEIDEPKSTEKKKSRKSLDKKSEKRKSMENSTPTLQKFFEDSPNVKTPKIASTKKTKNTPESKGKGKSMSNLEMKFEESEFTTQKSGRLSLPLISKSSPLNKTLAVPQIDSPGIRSLMKEKLNDTLPALKLQQRRSLKESRRSLLENVNESENDNNEEAPEETVIEKMDNNETETTKKPKKKKKKKNKKNIAEDISEIEDKEIVVKNKKDKNNENIDVNSIQSPKLIEKSKKKKKNDKLETVKTIVSPITTKNSKKRLHSTELSPALSINSSKNQQTKIDDKKIKSRTNKNIVPSIKHDIKRLPEEILENLTDIPARPKKRRKLNPKELPSRTMFDSEHKEPDYLTVEDIGYIPLSSSGGTTEFSVVNLNKPSTKRSKKSTAVLSFRERLLSRHPRQPISAYLIYQQKLKASGRANMNFYEK